MACGLLFTTGGHITKDMFLSGLSEMKHRGPDAPLCFSEYGNVMLGHNRLSIIDLSTEANQPFLSVDKRYSLVFNGEIYNYKELARTHGIKMRTSCDSELLLSLSLKIGFTKVLEELNGMFAYVIYDVWGESFFAARDRLGVKPLYYAKTGEDIILSSEINAVVSLLSGKVTIDPVGVRQYKKMRTFFNDHTIYNEIKMFPAGAFMENGSIKKYWALPDNEQSPPSDEELRDLIVSAVEIRKMSDVPVGSYLSGGLDSTIVAALTKELHTWTVGFEQENEFEWGRIAAEAIGSLHHEVVADKDSFLKDAERIIKVRKEPLSVPNEVLLYKMTQKVKEKNTVILSGEGADELFFGYDRIFRWAAKTAEFDLGKFSELYSYGSEEDLEIVESVIAPYYKYKKPIWIVAAFFQTAHLHGLLRRLDNSTMLCSVEAREPFCDIRLVERMAGVSYEFRAGDSVKAPLKRIFSNIVPKEIIARKKVGFPVDLREIFSSSNFYDKWFAFNLQCLKESLASRSC
ncbi:MAG: asparagine synthase (glutamine-hydrolyzing) [Synergistaceae bacterium]|nr:asparagine synthase (glutamine-hydrolyzing) [Synergistaceae bacterium]